MAAHAPLLQPASLSILLASLLLCSCSLPESLAVDAIAAKGESFRKEDDRAASGSARLRGSDGLRLPITTGNIANRTAVKAVSWTPSIGNLQYFGGPILSGSSGKVYLIYYGSWSAASKQAISDFVNGLNGKNPKGKSLPSPRDWWEINTKNYYDSQKRYVTSNIFVSGQIDLGYALKPLGVREKPLTTLNVIDIIRKAFTKGLSFDPNGVYIVLTSPDVYEESFCVNTCSYHTYFTYQGKKVAFAFVGDSSSQCRLYCTYSYLDPSAVTYNGMAIDGVISMLAHELAGMSTNLYPGQNSLEGWVIPNTYVENVDFCTWVYGLEIKWDKIGPKIYAYNLIGPNGRKFIVQTNYNLKTRSCEMKYKS